MIDFIKEEWKTFLGLIVCVSAVVLIILFATEDNPCQREFGGTGKTSGTQTYLTGEYREEDGTVYLRCEDGEEVD